jgi:hypothetical protein
MRETQGKCRECGVRYVWTGRPLLRDALCRTHGTPLERTNYMLKWPVHHAPPATKARSRCRIGTESQPTGACQGFEGEE